MEPFDIDKIMRQKASENHGLHQQEMDSAKPFVWSALQNQIRPNKSLTWKHLAAAVVLLILCFSLVLISVQKKHQKEMKMLSAKFNHLQANFASQNQLIEQKSNQIASLTNQQRALNDKLSTLHSRPVENQKQIVVYHTDTIVIKQVEYINTVAESIAPTENFMEKEAFFESDKQDKGTKDRKVDDIIFPSHESQEKSSETLRVKFGSLASNRN